MKEKLEELKKWCIYNADEQQGMDSDGGCYASMEFLELDEIVKKIDEMIKD
jgi:hypothetical protein